MPLYLEGGSSKELAPWFKALVNNVSTRKTNLSCMAQHAITVALSMRISYTRNPLLTMHIDEVKWITAHYCSQM